MMKSMTEEARAGENWPPEEGERISFKSGDRWKTGVLQEVRWGLVWRDFILDDGRVIPEIKISGCPQPPVWRAASEVTQAEREAAEERLASMAESGLDPRSGSNGSGRSSISIWHTPISGLNALRIGPLMRSDGRMNFPSGSKR